MLAAHEHARCAAAVHCRTARAPRMMCAEPAEVQLTCLISAAGSLAVFCSVAALKLAFPLKRVQLPAVLRSARLVKFQSMCMPVLMWCFEI